MSNQGFAARFSVVCEMPNGRKFQAGVYVTNDQLVNQNQGEVQRTCANHMFKVIAEMLDEVYADAIKSGVITVPEISKSGSPDEIIPGGEQVPLDFREQN